MVNKDEYNYIISDLW